MWSTLQSLHLFAIKSLAHLTRDIGERDTQLTGIGLEADQNFAAANSLGVVDIKYAIVFTPLVLQSDTGFGELLRVRTVERQTDFRTAPGAGAGVVILFAHIGQVADFVAPQLFDLHRRERTVLARRQLYTEIGRDIGSRPEKSMRQQTRFAGIGRLIVAINGINSFFICQQRLSKALGGAAILHRDNRINTITGHIREKLKAGDAASQCRNGNHQHTDKGSQRHIAIFHAALQEWLITILDKVHQAVIDRLLPALDGGADNIARLVGPTKLQPHQVRRQNQLRLDQRE